jgi:hypothetical protein
MLGFPDKVVNFSDQSIIGLSLSDSVPCAVRPNLFCFNPGGGAAINLRPILLTPMVLLVDYPNVVLLNYHQIFFISCLSILCERWCGQTFAGPNL